MTCPLHERRRRILLAPIPVTPTKPLTPSHLKGMLAVDVMRKTTEQLAQVDCLYSNLTANGSEQTVGFWEYLDRKHGALDFTRCSEEDIGELYVRYHMESSKPTHAVLAPYLHAVENANWIHPSSARLHEIWSSHLSMLGIRDPGIARLKSNAMPLDELVQRLADNHLCVDLRAKGGALYLDATVDGLPLRQAITADGRVNYLINLLRDLVPQIPRYDHLVLIHDPELHADFSLLQKILRRLGGTADRVVTNRVAIEGTVRSARHGEWHGYTTTALASKCLESADLSSFQLGIRLYFIAIVENDIDRSFSMDRLRHFIRRASRLLSASTSGAATASVQEFLLRCARRRPYVDPYIVTSCLLSKRHPAPILTEDNVRWYM
jgi:hypothetical protein